MIEIQCEMWVGLSCIEETTTADFRELLDGTSDSRQNKSVLIARITTRSIKHDVT